MHVQEIGNQLGNRLIVLELSRLGRLPGAGMSKLYGKEAEIIHFLDKNVIRANIAKILDVSWDTPNNFIS